ncbi:MAG: polysaccharide biosynthesis C-terminal domain-containing protein, partial [Candidatus Omnitrophota bacterium]
VILRMLGARELGLYSIAIMMGNAVFNIANMVGIVLYPRFQEIYGRNDSKEEVFNVMIKILKLLWLPLIVLVAAGVVFAPYLIRMFTPKYIAGITAMKIFICGMYFLSLSKFCNHFLITINKQMFALYVCVTTVLINLMLNIVFVKMGFGIKGVAVATSISYFIYFLSLFTLSLVVRKGEKGVFA